jgi:cytochrome c-type biogenesis protein CcmF
MHYFIGDLGHFFIILSFVTSLISAFAYWKTINSPDETREPWRKNARWHFIRTWPQCWV